MPKPETSPPDAPDSPIEAEAEYQLETAVACPGCTTPISTLRVVRMLRSRVNFTSTLPRRGRAVVCPACRTVISAELGNL